MNNKLYKTQRLSWFGHMNRISERMVKKLYKWNPNSTRPKIK